MAAEHNDADHQGDVGDCFMSRFLVCGYDATLRVKC